MWQVCRCSGAGEYVQVWRGWCISVGVVELRGGWLVRASTTVSKADLSNWGGLSWQDPVGYRERA